MHTNERLKELARRSGKTINIGAGKEGCSVRIDGRDYKITLEQYEQLLDWLAGVDAVNNKYSLNMEWQPIETAPKDGTKILAWPCYSSGVHQVFWHEGPRKSGWKDYLGFVPVPPTHWIPTPAPPKETK